MLTEEKVLKALSGVMDPEININIVDLGLVYGVKVSGPKKDKVHVKMTLTTPGCPLSSMFPPMVEEAVKKAGAKEAVVELTFHPPWTPDRISKQARKKLGI